MSQDIIEHNISSGPPVAVGLLWLWASCGCGPSVAVVMGRLQLCCGMLLVHTAGLYVSTYSIIFVSMSMVSLTNGLYPIAARVYISLCNVLCITWYTALASRLTCGPSNGFHPVIAVARGTWGAGSNSLAHQTTSS